MANVSNGVAQRNVVWLSQQKVKLARVNEAKWGTASRVHSNNSNNPPNVVLVSATSAQSSVAFSNPIYEEFAGFLPPDKEPDKPQDEVDEEDLYIDRDTLVKPRVKKPIPERQIPVPRPRRTKLVPSPMVPIDEPGDNTDFDHPEIYENVPASLEQSDAVVQSTSFLYFEKELPAKMAQLLSEIELLADSLVSDSSDLEDGQTPPKQSPVPLSNTNTKNIEIPSTTTQSQSAPIPTYRRKRIQVQKELFKFSFSSGSDIASPTITEFNPLEIATRPMETMMVAGNKDSGIFSATGDSGQLSSGDSSHTNSTVDRQDTPPSMSTEHQTNVASHDQSSISSPHSPPPKLPPRKHSRPTVDSPTPPPKTQPKSPSPPPSLAAHRQPSPKPSIPSSMPPSRPPPPTRPPQSSTESPAQSQPNVPVPNAKPPTTQPPPLNTLSANSAQTQPPPPTQLPLLPLNSDLLSMEHLHLNKLSLQRSGYLWKTGPNHKSFKYRWCILYRHNLDLSDANFSYYFNRSSISASLSGKIMIAEIEFIAVCESVPVKTKVPKLEPRSDDPSGGGVCFLEIGVRCRQGRVYLFAARANIDRQLWMHAFVQALCLHAFKNKELYQFGFVRAKFTITTKWQHCFALLTTDRFLYIFEMMPAASEATSMIRAINCKNYHIFNLRKTVRVSKLDEPNGIIGGGGSLNSPITTTCNPSCANIGIGGPTGNDCCKNGFSLTQNGGRVVYILADYESHLNRWYRSIIKFWQTPDEPEQMLFEEQYLTKDNIPVAIDKCLKFLDTFNLTANTQLFTALEHQHPQTLANSTKLLADFQANAWNVHLLPQQYSANQISLLLLLYLRSMNQCIFTDSMLSSWVQLAQTIEQQTNEPQQLTEHLEVAKSLLEQLPQINYATLRRMIICLANANLSYPLSSSLCKALMFSKQKNAMVPVSAARSLLTSLIKHHLYLFEVTREEVDKEMHIKRVVHLIINQQMEDQQLHNPQSNNTLTSPLIGGGGHDYQNNFMAAVSGHPLSVLNNVGTGPPNTVIDTRQLHSLIIGVRVVYGNNGNGGERTVVNVHLSRDTCADDVLDMVLQKAELPDDPSQYSLFEVVCYRRLERVVFGGEPVLPVVLSWSSWPSHWCAEAALEVRHSDSLMKGSLALLHNKDKYAKLLSPTPSCASTTSSTSSASESPVNRTRVLPSKSSPRHPLKRTSQSVRCRPSNTLANQTPNIMMSVIRYCGQSDTRLAKKILAEFSNSSLFLYCKESHQLLGQHPIADLYWYVGIESSTIAHTPSMNTTTSGVPSNADEQVLSHTTPNFTTAGKSFHYGSSVKGTNSTNIDQNSPTRANLARRPTAPALLLNNGEQLSVPALTLVERRLLHVAQSKDRLNFGQTLVFNNWNELYQWIRALLTASAEHYSNHSPKENKQ